MKREYYLIINGQQQGPYSETDLRQFVIYPNTLVWYQGLSNWTEAMYLQDMSSFIAAPSYVPPSYAAPSAGMVNQRVSISYSNDNNYVTVTTDTERIHYQYADFGERFVARLLDSFIAIFPNMFFPILGGWLYFALMQSSDQQATVGQNVMKIRVLDCAGDKVTFGQASGRYFAAILSAMTMLIGYFMFFWTDKKQTLHDNLAETIVVKEIGRERVDTFKA